MPGGPTVNVDWISSDWSTNNLNDFDLNLPAATLSLLVIEPGLDRLVPILSEQDGETWFSVKFHPLPYASAIRYQLLGSADLATWEVVAETATANSEWISLSENHSISDSTNRFFRVESVRE
jgi:hypothetical protein